VLISLTLAGHSALRGVLVYFSDVAGIHCCYAHSEHDLT